MAQCTRSRSALPAGRFFVGEELKFTRLFGSWGCVLRSLRRRGERKISVTIDARKNSCLKRYSLLFARWTSGIKLGTSELAFATTLI